MKRLVFIIGLVALMVGSIVFVTRPLGLPAEVLPNTPANVANGERLFHVGGCASCHRSTDSESDTPVLGGGLEMNTPFGTFRVPNISPHPTSGIGAWTRLDFVNAMKMGTSPDGRHYYPAFPYASYIRMSVQDVLDLKSYLDTLPEAEDINKDHDLGFPWSVRAGIGMWKILNLDSEAVISMPSENGSLMRGRYLVEGPGHCGECHTPRNWSGGLDKSLWLTGAPNPDGEGKVPDITPGGKTIKDWSQEDIEYYLESGLTPDYDTVGGSMVEVQENLARVPAEDRAAIAAYLKALPAD